MAKCPVPKKKKPQAIQYLDNVKQRNRKPKSTSMELVERREAVTKLRLKGLTLREIGKELGLGYMIVKRDLDCIKQEVGEKITKFDRDFALGKSISVYEQIEDEAWKQYFGCAPGSTNRAQFLNVARAARNDQVKLLSDVGMIVRAPTHHAHTVESTSKLLEGWTPDAKNIVSLAIIRAQMDGTSTKELTEGSNGKSKIVDVPEDVMANTPYTMGLDD
jgi:hypothetical protein